MTDSDKPSKKNIFEIIDGIMFELSRTKKMFMIMILTTLIIPPIVLLVMTSVFEPPFGDRFEDRLEDRLQDRLQNGNITPEEYQDIKNKMIERGPRPLIFAGPQLVIFGIALGWLAVGIRQWIVLSKWNKQYQQFKKEQEDIDKKLDDSQNDDEDKLDPN